MATYTKFQQAIEDIFHGVHNFGSDQFTVALVAAANAPNAATNAVLAELTEVSYTNCSTRNITTASSGQTGGNYVAAFTDLVLTASGGTVGPFRYVVIYNNTPTSPLDPLLGYYDYGSDLTLADTETFTIDFAASSITAS